MLKKKKKTNNIKNKKDVKFSEEFNIFFVFYIKLKEDNGTNVILSKNLVDISKLWYNIDILI